MATSPLEMKKRDPNAATPWREERVFIVPHAEGFQVVPPYKVVSKGQEVTFRSFGCDRLRFEGLNPEVFDEPQRTNDPTVVTVHVKEDAKAGFYPYSAKCIKTVDNKEEDAEARGASPPGMIVDP